MTHPSPHQPAVVWLHPRIKALIESRQAQGEIPHQHWQAASIQGLYYGPFPRNDCWFHVEHNGKDHYVRLSRLSLGRLQALCAFMTEREAVWQPRQPLAGVKQRPLWQGRLVFVCHCIYSNAHIARIIHHARDHHREHLGDAWLVQFKGDQGEWGGTSYIFADMVYPAPLPAPLRIGLFESLRRLAQAD